MHSTRLAALLGILWEQIKGRVMTNKKQTVLTYILECGFYVFWQLDLHHILEIDSFAQHNHDDVKTLDKNLASIVPVGPERWVICGCYNPVRFPCSSPSIFFYRLELRLQSYVALADLWWNIDTNQSENHTSLDLVVVIRSACLLILSN